MSIISLLDATKSKEKLQARRKALKGATLGGSRVMQITNIYIMDCINADHTLAGTQLLAIYMLPSKNLYNKI